MVDPDAHYLRLAMAAAAEVRLSTSPNPWVGAVVVGEDVVAVGATQPPGAAHAEVEALARAGERARGATLFVTLEPCVHQGRTGPCTDAIVDAGISRVVIGITDPDPLVAGRGVSALREAGLDVSVRDEPEIARQLAPYVHHRSTGRPYVVLKLAATLDGRTAALDGSSRWITGREARSDAHRLRAESDAVLVGAGTVRSDDPALTVRDFTAAVPVPPSRELDPLRVVLGRAGSDARIQPALELRGDLGDILDELGRRGVLQLLVEGGAGVAGAFHRAGLVDRYVVYLAPALLGGDDGLGLFRGSGATTMADAVRGRFDAVTRLGADLRIEFVR